MLSHHLRGFLLLLTLSLFATSGPASPLPRDDDPAVLMEHQHHHRLEEARTKERAAKAWLKTPAGKTPNQENYDVHYYKLDLDVEPVAYRISGVVTVKATVTMSSLDRIELHLKDNLTVLGATSAGQATSHTHSGGILTVTLDRTYATGENVKLTVSYQGDPSGAAFGFDLHSGQDMIWTLSEPYGAREWWPCKDLNTDKADSLDVIVTVPDNLVVASQGLLVSETSDGSSRTFHWHSDYPTATYLVSLAIHPYARYSDWYTPLAGGDPMEVQYFVYPENYPGGTGSYYLTPDMIGAFAGSYGEYPFVNEKYGHADFIWGGGMEHQTISSMGFYFEDLISHELAHQWWGDMVTCADFGHIWLNEGFATWSEAHWAEQRYGRETYQEYMSTAAFYGPGTIFVEDPLTEVIFDGNLSYDKGSWVVHMLRGVLGDEDFFAGLQQYRANHLYGSATTEDLQAALESVSGLDLSAFFQQWIYGEFFPVYAFGWAEGPGPGQITVTIDQVQDNAGVFTMPVQLRITTDQGVTDVTVQNDQASQSFTLAVAGVVQEVALDPDRWILRQVQEAVTSPSLDEGVLLVNGVSWDTYGSEITAAYGAQAFWGDTPISFWDCFPEPGAGYPATLPAPLGHGHVPASVLGRYSTVIWVGNNYGGDLSYWAETAVLSYLQAGGNVLLMTRMAQDFLGADLAAYLGVSFAESSVVLGNCVAEDSPLLNMAFTGYQNYNDVLSPTVGPETTILFRETVSFSGDRVTGAVVRPAAGGTHRPDGGRLAFISGRPYRMEATALRNNVEVILSDFLLEPYEPDVVGVEDQLPLVASRLGQTYPNPFNPRTVIPFELAGSGQVALAVFDARGRLVKELVRGEYEAGIHQAVWTGLDDAGRALPSGVYFARLRDAAGRVSTTRMTLVR